MNFIINLCAILTSPLKWHTKERLSLPAVGALLFLVFPALRAMNVYGQGTVLDKEDMEERELTHKIAVKGAFDYQDESNSDKALLLIPRLVSGPIKSLTNGRTVKRVKNTLLGIYQIAAEDSEKGKLCLGDGLFNPMGTAAHAISDLVSVIKSPTYATSKTTERVQLCTINLASPLYQAYNRQRPRRQDGSENRLGHLLNPADHVAVMVDFGETHTVFPGRNPRNWAVHNEQGKLDLDNILCTPLPILSNETETIAVEKARCALNKYNPEYSFLMSNCGAYTKDILDTAGLGYPGLLNLGIGNELGVYSEMRKAHLKRVQKECSVIVENIRQVMSSLEGGDLLNDMEKSFLRGSYDFGPDTLLQLILSTARNPRSRNIKFIQGWSRKLDCSKFSIYLDGDRDLGSKVNDLYLDHLKSMFQGITKSDLLWPFKCSEQVFNLYNKINKTPLKK